MPESDDMTACEYCGKIQKWGHMFGMFCSYKCREKSSSQPDSELMKALRVGEFKTMTADQTPKKEEYPSPTATCTEEKPDELTLEEITLRDYYAGQAMLTQVSQDMAYHDTDKAAKWNYGYADSMMKKRGGSNA